MNDERRIDRMAGCSCLGKIILGAFGILVIGLVCPFNLRHCFMSNYPHPRESDFLRNRALIKDVKISLESFAIEYGKFPIASAAERNGDFALSSRGPMLEELCFFNAAKLNFKKIKFIDLPLAKNHKLGLWLDGSECALIDTWGEPYYIILDTDKDNVITNPEFGADLSNPEYAERCRNSPPPTKLPAKVIIYSSGADRDPKTWNDNICSWRN